MCNFKKMCKSGERKFTYKKCTNCRYSNSCDIKDIISLICSAGDTSDACGSNGIWTETLNTEFIHFFQKKQLKVFCTADEADGKEWLYDITICKQTEDYIKETFLVAESEWSGSEEDIWYDFQKLLLCNSKYKVMIFIRKDEDEQNSMFSGMEDQIKLYNKCNGTFILAGFVNHIGYTFKIVDCGSQS